MNKIRILIADDQTLMRDGLKTILDLEEDMEVVGTAGNGLQAYQMIETLQPDIVLMDIRMPEIDGVTGTKMIKSKYPHIVVIILTTFNDEEYIIQALTFGASGYLLKDMQGDKLIQAIRESASGNLIMPASVAAKLAARLAYVSHKNGQPELEKIPALSEREKEIAWLLIKGISNRQMAASLYISEGTVKNYVSSIYNKIGLNDRIKAVQYLKAYLQKY